MNGFKKHNGRIGQKAKELVTKWKELIPDKAPPDQRPSNATPQGSSVTPTSRHRKEPHPSSSHPTPLHTPSSSHPTPSQSHTPNKARISNDVTLPSMGSSGRASSGSWSTKDRTPLPYTESESREDEHGSSINSSTGNLAKKRKGTVCVGRRGRRLQPRVRCLIILSMILAPNTGPPPRLVSFGC